ncbi:hypothetical protein [Wenyingzhuangia sp. IMCC45574]
MKYDKEQLITSLNKKRNVLFLLFVMATSIFWFLNRLSNVYTQQVSYRIKYQNLPDRFVFQDEPQEAINVSVEATGFYLLSSSLRQKSLKISLKNIKRKNKYQYYLLEGELNRQVKEEFHDRIKILGVSEDSLFINLGKKGFKKVPVVPHLDLNFFNGYKSFEMELQPDSIIVSGPEMQVNKVRHIDLKVLQKNDVMEPIQEKIAIIPSIHQKVTYSHTLVGVSLAVEKITEKKLEIPVKILNAPKDEVVIYPKKVNVICQVKLSLFQEIQAKDFQVICDYNKKESKYIKAELVVYPENVSKVKLVQDKVEFLILK